MPTAHTRFSFKFDELTDDAKSKAVETVAEKLGGEWWDSNDADSVSETIIGKLAEIFKSPGYDEYGVSEFPGINGITMSGWDLERGSYLLLSGHLTRENAPGLPWSDSIHNVTLSDNRWATTVDVNQGDVEFTCTSCGQDAVWDANTETLHHIIQVPGGTADDDVADDDHTPVSEGLPDREALCNGFKTVVKDAIDAALKAGREQAEYVGSNDSARLYIDGNEPDFNEDGTLF